MSKLKVIGLVLLILLYSQIREIPAQTLGATGEKRGRGTIVLKAAQIIDGTGAEPIKNGIIVITDDKIVAVGNGPRIQIPADARLIDLGNATLLPGFIDAHTHIIGRVVGDPEGQNSLVRDYDSF